MFVFELLIGALFLYLGGEALVHGASALALRLRLTPTVIGLTVMALGTSLPELVVSIAAQLGDSPDIAFGNVVGSNLFNVGLVVGLCALIAGLPIPSSAVRLEWPVMLLSAVIAMVFAQSSGEIDTYEGLFFLLALVGFVAYVVRVARREVSDSERRTFRKAVQDSADPVLRRSPLLRPLSLVIIGGVCLHFGAGWFVDGAQELAKLLGVSDRIIALTVVAAGTGAPELFSTIVAAMHKKTDMAIGNIIGSNIFNTFGILGTAAVIKPLSCNPQIISWDLWWMLAISVILGPFLLGRRVRRWEGAVLLGIYLAYLASLVIRA